MEEHAESYCAIFRPASVSSAPPDSTLHNAPSPNANQLLNSFVYHASFADSAVKKREECSSQAAGFQCTLPPHGIEFIQHGAQGTVCVATWQGRLIACKSIPLSFERVIAAELGAVSVPSIRRVRLASACLAWRCLPEPWRWQRIRAGPPFNEACLQMRRTSSMSAHINRIQGQDTTTTHRLLYQDLAVGDLRDYMDATVHGL